MRVLHIYKDYAPVVGGIENTMRLMAEGLTAEGIDVEVLVTNTGRTTQRTIIGGVPVTKTGRLLNVSSAPVSLGFYSSLRRLTHNTDIVHAHLPYPPGELGQLLVGRSRRFVVTYHSDIVRQKVLGTLYSPFLRQVLRKADLISATSDAYVRSSAFLAPVADKCRVIPLGIDLTAFQRQPAIEAAAVAQREQYGPRPLLLFVGKLRHYKGLDVLIRAMPQVDARLLVVGSGPMEQEWRTLADGLQLDERVLFLGERPEAEKVALLHAADLFVLPSTNRAEAFGVVLIEAMAAGLPLISTELGTGTSFVNQHEETGLVVPAGDVTALAAAINRMISDAPLRERMGAASVARATKMFSKEALIRHTLAFYEEALAA